VWAPLTSTRIDPTQQAIFILPHLANPRDESETAAVLVVESLDEIGIEDQ
jgi:hypothetical protein